MLSEDKKKEITDNFLNTIAEDLINEHLTNLTRRKILRNCFKKALPNNNHKLNKIYDSLKSKKFSDPIFLEYDCLRLTISPCYPSSLRKKIKAKFVNNFVNVLALSDSTFKRMQKITNSVPLLIKPYVN